MGTSYPIKRAVWVFVGYLSRQPQIGTVLWSKWDGGCTKLGGYGYMVKCLKLNGMDTVIRVRWVYTGGLTSGGKYGILGSGSEKGRGVVGKEDKDSGYCTHFVRRIVAIGSVSVCVCSVWYLGVIKAIILCPIDK